MALSRQRIHQGAETDYPWEREAIDFVLDTLPDVDPYNAWPLVEFVVPSTGQLYEVDLLVLSRHCLYLVEIKSHPGELTGDSRDWCFTHEGRRSNIENPLYVTNRKARVLGNMLKRELPFEHQVWVDALVFLSNENLTIRLDQGGQTRVTTRGTFRRAVTHADFPGSTGRRAKVVDRPTMRAVVQALHKLGVRPSKARRLVGEYQLGELLAEGIGYQEHLGQHRDISGLKARVRSYLVPRATTVERQEKLRRAAQNEAQTLTSLGAHPSILKCMDYKGEGPLGPALVFEPFEDGEPLDLFIRRETGLPFDDRLEILERVTEALHFCHRRGTFHRNLCPSSVLVRHREGSPVEVRLHSFQLSLQPAERVGTRHISTLTEERGLVYRAPEVIDDPTKATAASDVFSLGALAYFVLSGQEPASNLSERDQKLLDHEGLRLSAVRDDISSGVDDVVAAATNYYASKRLADNAMDWLGLLLDVVTKPDPVERPPETDPHVARPGMELTGEYLVRRELGSGSTARVLQVAHQGKSYALKVPHDEGCSEQLRAECEVLSRLPRHAHIVGCHNMVRLGGRDCLLLDFAGSDNPEEPQTLADLLARDGTVGLDYARRFGDDLLSALQHLEENGVQHRDVKPANIGFTPSVKKARHLVLFDFSFASDDVSGLTGGTPQYRDPHLRLRGAWDSAADRYSAAVVLHEMLTGLRPTMPEEGSGASGGGLPRARIEAERLDAGLRDRLVLFFERALASDAEQRFPSSEEMKVAWLAVFVDSPASVEAAEDTEPKAEIEVQVTPQTPVEALSLSSRARNALDRAGVATAGELAQLPRNQLSAVRGVGRTVAQEIHEVAEDLRQRFSQVGKAAPTAFAPDYQGRKLALEAVPELGLAEEPRERLLDAGIMTTLDLATTSSDRVVRLLGSEEAQRLRDALMASGEDIPEGSISSWVAELLPLSKGTKSPTWQRHIRSLIGLDPLPGKSTVPLEEAGALDGAAVASAFGISPGAIRVSLQKARDHWDVCPGRVSLSEDAREVVSALGGVCTLDEGAREMARDHVSDPDNGLDHLREAGALLRLVTEIRTKEGAEHTENSLVQGRIAEKLWLATSRQHLDLVRQLGGAADRLASAEPLPSNEKVRETLMQVVKGTPLALLPAERLVKLAARASSGAAASSRLEIYPVGMSPDRAVALSTSVLSSAELGPSEVRERLTTRYPEAAAPPERPELDRVLAAAGLVFDASTGRYRRRDQALPTTTGPGIVTSRLATALPHQAPKLTPTALEARSFDETLRISVERGRFRVLQVGAREAEAAGRFIGNALGVEPVSLDKLLWSHVDALRPELGVELDALIEVDRQGPSGPYWSAVRDDLVRPAAARMIAEILTNRENPWLLVHPGALAHYGLDQELQELIERAESEDGAAVLLLVPSYDDGALPSINGTMAVPAPLPGQRLRVPGSWLRNEHRAAAEELTNP